MELFSTMLVHWPNFLVMHLLKCAPIAHTTVVFVKTPLLKHTDHRTWRHQGGTHQTFFSLLVSTLGGVQAAKGRHLSAILSSYESCDLQSRLAWKGMLVDTSTFCYTSGLFHRKKHIFGTANWGKDPCSGSQHAPGVKLLLLFLLSW